MAASRKPHSVAFETVPDLSHEPMLVPTAWQNSPPSRDPIMLVKYSILGAASGKLGGIVASHNSGGDYFRTLGQPVNPATPAQVTVRNILANLAATWTLLSDTFRDGWETYAANVPVPGRFGDPINLSGQQMYIRNNVAREQAGLVRVNKPPTIFTNDTLSPVVIAPVEVTDILNIEFNVADGWVNDDDAGLLVYGSRQQNPSVNFFKGGYQFAGVIEGDSALPPTSPNITIASLFELTAGNHWFGRVLSVRSDGRISVPQLLQQIVVGI